MFALVTAANSSTAVTLGAQFHFVNASFSSGAAASHATGLLLQLKSSTFPPFPSVSSCTLCISLPAPSFPPGTHAINLNTHTSALLLAHPSTCPNSTQHCPLSFQSFNATSFIDAAVAPLVIHAPALFHPSSVPAASTRTIIATMPRFSMPANTSFTAVSSGADFGCGLAANDAQCSAGSSNVYCWGSYNLNSKW